MKKTENYVDEMYAGRQDRAEEMLRDDFE